MPLLQVYWDRPTRARMGLISTFINMAVLGFSIMVVFSVVFVKFSMAETSSIVENLFSRREIRSKTVIHHAWIFGLIGGIFLAYHFVAPIIPYDNSNTQKRWSWGLRALQIHLAITLASFVIAIVTSALAGANMVWKLEENLRTSIERMKISPLLHQIQVEFKCCGANGYHPGIGDVYSCCRPNYVERDCSAGSNWNVEAKIKADMFYSQECPAAVARRFEAYAILITVAFALIAFLKVIN